MAKSGGQWGETEGLGLPIAPGAQKVTFKAWSDEGGEKVDFFVGYSSDGFSASKPAVTLSDEPTIYEMDIHCYDYARVAGGFGWSMETVELTQPVNVYIAEVQWTNEANANPVDCVALEEERLSLGVFYDGPASETYDIDDVVRHLYVYEETVSITTTDQTFEGAVANTIGYNNCRVGGAWVSIGTRLKIFLFGKPFTSQLRLVRPMNFKT